MRKFSILYSSFGATGRAIGTPTYAQPPPSHTYCRLPLTAYLDQVMDMVL